MRRRLTSCLRRWTVVRTSFQRKSSLPATSSPRRTCGCFRRLYALTMCTSSTSRQTKSSSASTHTCASMCAHCTIPQACPAASTRATSLTTTSAATPSSTTTRLCPRAATGGGSSCQPASEPTGPASEPTRPASESTRPAPSQPGRQASLVRLARELVGKQASSGWRSSLLVSKPHPCGERAGLQVSLVPLERELVGKRARPGW
mmetsp:Transcript_32965/g.98160  ORF Transcript_32965/g.98160 Transcript_32965/m.98160 type:complete len:204 (-) Transcript_32965:342-953(-)